MTPENLAGSPFEEEYARIAPKPEDWPRLIARVQALDREIQDWPPETIRAIKAPTLLIIGGDDEPVVSMNREAAARLRCPHEIEIVPGATHLFEEPGALEHVAASAARWFKQYLI